MARINLTELHRDDDLDHNAMQEAVGGYFTNPGVSLYRDQGSRLYAAMQRARVASSATVIPSLTPRYNVNPYSTSRYSTPYSPLRYSTVPTLFSR